VTPVEEIRYCGDDDCSGDGRDGDDAASPVSQSGCWRRGKRRRDSPLSYSARMLQVANDLVRGLIAVGRGLGEGAVDDGG
jgi:hypothetical protein